MADKETGLNIPVSAVADKDSAKEAVNELTKGVLSSLKDGYIEIPAELKVPIKGASKDLEKAQKDVIKQWEKTFKEGFSSSAKDLDDLTEAYQRFKKLAGQQHKAGTKQSRGISAIMGEQIQAYSTSKKDTQVRRNEFKKQIEKAQKRNSKRGMTADEKKLLKEEIDAAIAQDYKRKGYGKLSKELSKGASRAKAATPGSPTNLGIRSPAMGGPYTSERTLRMSEISPYRNVDEVRRAKEQQEIRAAERRSLTSRRATQEDIDSVNKNVKQREASGRAQSGTEYELIKKALLTEVAKLQGGLIKGRPDATSQKLIDQVLANLTYDEQQGVDPLKSIMGIHNMLQKRYDTKGKIGATDGTPRGEGPNQKEVNETLKQIYKILGQFIEARQSVVENIRTIKDSLSGKTATSKGSLYSQELAKITNSDQMKAMKEALNPVQSTLMRNLSQNTRESAREGVADQAAGRASREANSISSDVLETVSQDASTGFNTDQSANELIKATSSGFSDLYGVLSQIGDTLNTILSNGVGGGGTTKSKDTTRKDKAGLPSDMVRDPETGLFYKSSAKGTTATAKSKKILPLEDEEYSKYKNAKYKRLVNSIEEERTQIETGKHKSQQRTFLETSDVFTSQKGIFGQIKKAFRDLLPKTEVDRIMSMNAAEQARARAERIETYGLNRGRDLTDTGDIADVKRTKSLFGWIYKNDEKNKQLFQDVKLTPGFTKDNAIDTTAIMQSLNKVLSGSEMFKAQTGGTLRNIIGSFTGYIGMPSIEKSRAQAEGLNQVMANVRNEVLELIQDIQAKEATLTGMQERGTAKFDAKGYITSDSSLAAQNTFTKLEEQKQVLASALAEVGMIDQVVDKTGGKVSKIIKNIGFVMPELMKNNTIIQNINAGLDKNGKALKFQTRFAEILNYSFQLMSRHIGQILKNWLWMINPLNVIKKLFDDYASYDPKWQRTMNVIKNNFREIILPFMQKIAQTIVNIIGFLDIILQKVQAAFGYTPISLFDQENANKFKKTYEEIENITAGFDELHDIGSSGGENDPDNLLGEIYKPELSQDWIDLANEIGDLFAGLIKGDLGFGDVMKKILEIAWDGLQTLWNWFKNTEVGQWLINNWKSILATILGIFLGWKLLKIAGSALFKALFGKLTSGSIGGLFSKIGGWITKALNATSIGSGILQGLSNTLVNGGGLIKTLKYAFTYPGLITQMGGWGQMLGMALVQGLGVAIGAAGIMKGFDMNADNASYNLGLTEAGGDDEDKKSNFWGTALGTVSGAVAGGALIGGPIGAAVGAVAGLLITSLAPAFEQVEVAARDANNEMQKIEYYEGQVQGYSSQVSELEELQQVLNDTLKEQTDNVYAEGEQLGITKTRMDELVTSVQNGTFNTSMLSGAELGLKDSLIQLSEQQTKNQEATERLEEAKRKLQKAEIDLAIAEDVAAGNFEMAAARIDYAEAASLYTTEEATKKRIQLYKEAGKEEAAALLQDLTPEQRQKMANINEMTEEELASFVETWRKSSDEAKEAFLSGVDQDTQNQFESQMNEIDSIIEEHQGFWQGVGDTLKEIFTFGIADTWTYNGEKKATAEYKSRVVPSAAVGMNYVPNDGLIYVHQGEAIIPKKYNRPYQPENTTNQAYIEQMMNTMRTLNSTIQQGITVKGEFKQRGSDLVATVEKAKNRNGNQPLNNAVFAR